MKKTSKYLIAILIGLTTVLTAKDIPSPFFVTLGADVNGTIYTSDFKGFSGIENCCTSFSSAFGLSYNIHAGIEYRSKIFGMQSALDLSFSWSDISAEYNPQYEFANIISGNSYTKGISEFKLNPSLQLVSIEPGWYFTPIESLPLSFRIGFNAGILMGKSFSQQENLIAPENVFFENGTRTRGVYSGSIPNAESVVFGLSAGARIKAARIGSITLYPEIKFNYGLTDLVKGLEWKTSAIQAGVMIAFNIPGGRTEPPMNPPFPIFPDAPQPPAPSFVHVKLGVDINGISLKNGDEFKLQYTDFVTLKKYSLLPIIFYGENSHDRIDNSEKSEQNIGEVAVHNSLIESVARLMKEKPELELNLVSSSLVSEETTIIDNRINKVAEELQYYGIAINRINITKKQFKKEEFKEPLLAEENINIRFELSDGTKLIPYTITEKTGRKYEDAFIKIKPEIVTTSDIIKFDGNVAGFFFKSFDKNGLSANITPLVVKNEKENELKDNLLITANAINSDGTKAGTEFSVKISAEGKEEIVSVNTIPGSNERQFILCYFEYDRSDPKVINADVAAMVREAISNGKKVTFLAQTDNLGTEIYNSDLAMKRGRKAMELFNGNSGKIALIQPSYYIFSNLSPLGRMLNRTVIVRIEE